MPTIKNQLKRLRVSVVEDIEDSLILQENRIVAGMMMNTEFLRRMYLNHRAYRWTHRQFTSPCNALVKWCLDFYRKYNKAPNEGDDLRTIFDKERKNMGDEYKAELIQWSAIFSSQIYELEPNSDLEKWELGNIDFLYEEAIKFLNIRKFKELKDSLCVLDTDGNPDDVLEACEEAYNKRIQIKKDLVQEDDSITGIFSDREEFNRVNKRIKPLITFSGDVGKLISPLFYKTGFVSFLGREKIGKSWLLQEVVVRSLYQGKNVAWIQCGDMSIEDCKKRLYTRLCKHSTELSSCGEICIPIPDCQKNQNNSCHKEERCCSCGVSDLEEYTELLQAVKNNPKYVPCHECNKSYIATHWGTIRNPVNPLTSEENKKIIGQFFEDKRHGRLVLRAYPAASFTTTEFKGLIDYWTGKNFFPDVVVIDYMDIMDASEHSNDWRSSQNILWMKMRGLAQEHNILIVTATQADAQSYDKDKLLDMNNFSEDKRKLSHVTGMIGINQTNRQKAFNCIELNVILNRNGSYDPSSAVTVCQSLDTGQAIMGSYRSHKFFGYEPTKRRGKKK